MNGDCPTGTARGGQFFDRRTCKLPVLVGIMAVAYLALCVLLDWRGFQPVVVDSHSYLETARTLLHSGGFLRQVSPGVLEPEYARTPGYPLLLAGALSAGPQAGVAVAVYAQRLAWIVFVFCFVYWSSPDGSMSRWVLLSPMLLFFLPVSLVVTSSILAETAYTILAASGVALLASVAGTGNPRRAAIAGFLLGAATLVRPLSLHLPLVLAGASIIIAGRKWRTRRGAITVFLVLAYLLPGVWMYRNWSQSGHFSLSSLAGPGLALHRAEVIRTLPPEVWESMDQPNKYFVHQVRQTGDVFYAWSAVRRVFGINDFEAGALAYQVGMAAIRQAPLDYLQTSLRNLWVTFASPSDGLLISGLLAGREELKESELSVAVRSGKWLIVGLNLTIRVIYLLLVVILPAWLLLHAGIRRARDPLLLFAGVAGAYLIFLPAALTITYDRFLFPVLPAVCLIYCRKHYLNSRLENQGG